MSHNFLLTAKKGPLKGQTMKKIVGICMLAATSAFAPHVFADTAQTATSASRWSVPSMDRHMPVDAARLHKQGQKKFRYMDMAQGKRSRSLHNAVLVYGAGGRDQASATAPVYRDQQEPAQRPRVIVRPST